MLLQNLSLLFVPAGVGVVTQLDVLGRNWLPVTVAIVVSTILGLGVTAWLMQKLAAR
jgi:holin-like protein